MSKLRDTPKIPNLIYDVGLNLGQDTVFYLKKGYKVIAFEADPENVAFCRKRFAKDINDGSLTIVEGAISEINSNRTSQGTTQFYRNDDHCLWGSTSSDFAARNTIYGTAMETIDVKVVDFAAEIEKYGVPQFLKADIVGSEVICLRSMLGFANKPDYLSIRSEKVVFRQLENEFDLLEQLGYHEFKAMKQDFEKTVASLPSNNDAKFHEFEDGSSGPIGEETTGKWKTRDAVLKEYKRVFVKYWLFGDYSYLVQTASGRRFIYRMERLLGRSVPGWYDTHAKHGSVVAK